MATYSKVKLSGAQSNNAPIPVSFAFIGSPMDIHSTEISSTILDELWLWISNSSTTTSDTYKLRVAGQDFIQFDLEPKTTLLVCGGVVFSGDGSNVTTVSIENMTMNGSFAVMYGYVNRITP